MLPYNTDNETMKLPEYGRNLQNLVEYCCGLEDREERTACAYGIAEVMATMFPNLVGENKDYSTIWDHINLLSGFKLDIDFPVEVLTKEKMNPKPDKIPYTSSSIRYRYYGKNIEKMIEKVADMEDGQEKDALISLLAHHMKKLMLIHNKEGVSDAKVLKDLEIYSNGKIVLDPATYLLHEFKEEKPVMPQKNKRKKKSR